MIQHNCTEGEKTMKKPYMIGLAGGSASGKSTLAGSGRNHGKIHSGSTATVQRVYRAGEMESGHDYQWLSDAVTGQ